MLAASTDSSQIFYYCKWHRLWAMDLPSTLKWRAYSGLLVLDKPWEVWNSSSSRFTNSPVHVLNCLQSWSLWDKNRILFTDEVLWDLLPFASCPLTWPWEGSSSVCSVKWRSFLELSSGAPATLVFMGCELPCWWKEPSAEHSFVSGNWILWTCGRVMWWCHFSFSLFTLLWWSLSCWTPGYCDWPKCCRFGCSRSLLQCCCSVWTEHLVIVWWSWLSEQYVWVKVPQACSHQGGNTKGIFNLLIFIEVFLVWSRFFCP